MNPFKLLATLIFSVVLGVLTYSYFTLKEFTPLRRQPKRVISNSQKKRQKRDQAIYSSRLAKLLRKDEMIYDYFWQLSRCCNVQSFFMPQRRRGNTGIDRGTYNGSSVLYPASDYSARAQVSGDDRKIFTFNVWFKKCANGSYQTVAEAYVDASNYFEVVFYNDDRLSLGNKVSGSFDWQLITTAKYRDTHAWQNLCITYDTTETTSSDRVKLYIDGEQVTAFDTASYPSLNYANCFINDSSTNFELGRFGSGANYFNGYMAACYLVGTAYDYTYFTRTSTDTGKLVAAAFSGSYTDNSHFWEFSDSSDSSGQGNAITTNSGGVVLDISDTPVDNHATLNSLYKNWVSNNNITLSNGNKTATGNAVCPLSIPLTSGKYSCQFTLDTNTNHSALAVYISSASSFTEEGIYLSYNTGSPSIRNKNVETQTGLAAYSATDTFEIKVDADTRSVQFRRNGSDYGTAETIGGTEPLLIGCGAVSTVSPVWTLDTGADSYTPSDSTYNPVSSANLPTDNVDFFPQDKANIVLYTGDDAATQAISGMGFQSDFLNIKNRDEARVGICQDSVRGFTAGTEALTWSETDSEGLGDTVTTAAQYGYISGVDSDGFTVARGATSPYYYTNKNNIDYWALGLLADNTSGSSNTDGSITSTVASSGYFSIVEFSGNNTADSTVGTGLDNVDYAIIKRTDTTGNWICNVIGDWSQKLKLNGTDTQSSSADFMKSQSGGIITLGTDVDVNASGGTYVIYCFKFGDDSPFTGGVVEMINNADGAFIPSDELLMFYYKNIDVAESHNILDQVRNTYNPADKRIYPDLSSAESTGVNVDFLKNGIKMRTAVSAGTAIWWGIKKNGGQLAA